MFSKFAATSARLEARILTCPHCGYETRTGLRVRRSGEKLPPASRRACPRCNSPVDIATRDCASRLFDGHPRHVRLVTQTSRPRPRRLRQFLNALRAPVATLAIMSALAFMSAPAMARAVTVAVDQEIKARHFASRSADLEGYCDSRIKSYRNAPASHDVWDELASACQMRLEAIRKLRIEASAP